MMCKQYWDLFWTTGMPEAWLLSRGSDKRAWSESRRLAGDGQGPGPLADYQPRFTGTIPGGPRGLA